MNKRNREKHISTILAKKNVGIAGAGGLGSNVAIALARSGIKQLTIIDFDIVEKSNLNRQYYFTSQIGKKKILALEENIRNINPFVHCSVSHKKLQKGSMWEPFVDVDVVVEALDTAEVKTRFIEEILHYLPSTPIVAASGVAGVGNIDRIQTKHLGNLQMVYDEHALSSDEDVLLAPKVGVMANWQAALVLEILIGDLS